MIPTEPESRSEILRATHILLLRVESATPGEWTPSSARIKQRPVDLVLALERSYKAEPRDVAGAPVRLAVEQAARNGPRFVALPGVWSGKALDPGARFVAFCVSAADRAPQILQEPSCFRVEPATALPDLELALRAGMPPLPIAALLARCAPDAAAAGFLFARYAAARTTEVLFGDLPAFDAVMAFVEAAPLTASARRLMLIDIHAELLLRDPAPPPFVGRLVLGAVRASALPDTQAVRETMLGTYLPNLLGIEGGAAAKPASAIFSDAPAARGEVQAILDRIGAPAPLRAWARA